MQCHFWRRVSLRPSPDRQTLAQRGAFEAFSRTGSTMSRSVFDDKFGADFIARAPRAPGVYRYLGASGEVLYVGKAKNLRRRFLDYRSATKKKVHHKRRALVRAATSLCYEQLPTEEDALLREGELIRELRPAYNIDGAYTFLYPSLGVGWQDKRLLLCFTTEAERFGEARLEWFGCFRSRLRAKLAFDCLVELLSLIGHREKSTRLPLHPRIKGSRLVGFRQVPAELRAALTRFLAGEEAGLPGYLARLLLDKPRARRAATEVEEQLATLRAFYDTDTLRLRQALETVGEAGRHVGNAERDALFIRSAFLRKAG
jgi:predicted GIY-YIG superfamily endonuclease